VAKGAEDGGAYEGAAVAPRLVASLVEAHDGVVDARPRVFCEDFEDGEEDFVPRIRFEEAGRER